MKNSDSRFIIQGFEKPFTFHEDPGHGWLEVPYQLLVLLKIESKITECSYRNQDTVYLEEDSDLSTFMSTYLIHLGLDPEGLDTVCFWQERCKNSFKEHTPIRHFRRYYIG